MSKSSDRKRHELKMAVPNPCRGCGTNIDRARKRRQYCSDACRVYAYVKRGDPSDCWLWTGPVNGHGYGVINVRTGTRLAHRRLMQTITDVPADMVVMHVCDNPPCCNPAHLRVATFKDNMSDMSNKGRHPSITMPHAIARGERHGNAKLTDSAVREIRSGTISISKAAGKFGVNRCTVCAARRGETWAHVDASAGVSLTEHGLRTVIENLTL